MFRNLCSVLPINQLAYLRDDGRGGYGEVLRRVVEGPPEHHGPGVRLQFASDARWLVERRPVDGLRVLLAVGTI